MSSSLYRLQTIANPNALNNVKYDTLVFILYNIFWRKDITVLSFEKESSIAKKTVALVFGIN